MKIYFILVALLVFTSVKAQTIIQYRIGLSLSSIKYNYEKNNFFQDNWRTTPFAGVNVNVKLNPNTKFSTGIEYTLKGEKKYVKDSINKNIKIVTNLHYLTIPLLIKKTFKDKPFQMVCGITTNFAIVRVLDSIYDNKENNHSISFSNLFKSFDWCGLIGMEYTIKQKINVQLYYSNSLANNAYKNFESAYSRSFQLSLAYKIH